MADVRIDKSEEKENSYHFTVFIEEGDDNSSHKVTMKKGFYKSLSTDKKPSEVVLESFGFLLDQEPKEAILGEFDIEVISNYFPEYKDWVKKI